VFPGYGGNRENATEISNRIDKMGQSGFLFTIMVQNVKIFN